PKPLNCCKSEMAPLSVHWNRFQVRMRPMQITSRQNPHIARVARLRHRRDRDRQQQILIDGRREFDRALEADIEILDVLFCRGHLENAVVDAWSTSSRLRACRLYEVTEAVFGKIAYGDRTDGIVAVAARPHVRLDDLSLNACPLIGIAEGVEKPGNLGAIVRSADGAGVDALVAVDAATDVYGPNAIRASLGTLFHVPIVETTPTAARTWLADRRIGVVAARPDADRAYTDVDLTRPVAIVFGSEADGVSSAWQGADVMAARVPMAGCADSLNVSVTAALFFYEAVRQRAAAEPARSAP
ncbi:MAG: TrmH family RNA methyltransferase, partial [Phycisphaerae bacterium]